PVQVEGDSAQQIGSPPRPVLEGGGGEVGGGQDEAPVIPNVDNDIGQCDLFDAPILFFDDDDITDPDGVGESQLHAGEGVGQGGLGSQSSDNGDDSGRGQH